MSAQTMAFGEAIDRLPDGSLLLVPDVTWEDYELILADLAGRPGIRVTYDSGQLEVMSPSRKHEKYKDFILQLVFVLAEEIDLSVESAGSTTFKMAADRKAVEPDTCFYVARADRIIAEPGDRSDLPGDPPPDLVVEIDVTNESSGKFPIYAALGVPEIWRYDDKRKRLQIYELDEESYREIDRSRSFPVLTPDLLSDFMGRAAKLGQKRALAGFRQWAREQSSRR